MAEELIIKGQPPIWDPPKINISKFLLECMKKYGKNIAQIDARTKTRQTYDELRTLSVRTALEMRARGVKQGDFVTICAANHMNTALPFFATLYLGAVVSPIHCVFSALEYRRMLERTQPKMIFCDQLFENKIKDALKDLNLETEVIVFERDFEPFIAPHEDEENFEVVDLKDPDNDMAVLVCTSGTSGFVKGVPLTHRCFFVSISYLIKYLDENDVAIIYSPISWSSGLKSLAQAAWQGSTRIIANYHPDKNLPLLSEYKVTTLLASPGKIIEMIRHPDFPKYNVQSHVKRLLYGGAPTTYEQAKMFRSVFTNAMCYNGYGSAEMCGLHAFFPFDDPMLVEKQNCCGRLFNEAIGKIIDIETGKTLGRNQRGEIILKSPYMMKGYYKDPEETAKVIDADGWLHTGDLGYFDDDDCLYCIDRIKEIMKYQINHVSPGEVENVILGHEGVLSVCVIGKRHEIDGSHPTAFIIKRQGYENLTEQEILDYTEDKLTDPQKLRGGVRFVKSFPMTASGKIRKLELRAILDKE